MNERKKNMLVLTMTASALLVLGFFAYTNDGNLLWFLPGIVVYLVNVWYWAKKPPKIVFD